MNRSREYPIRTDVVFQPNKFQAYHFKPLSQFSFIGLYGAIFFYYFNYLLFFTLIYIYIKPILNLY